MVEIEIGNMNKQCLDRRIASMEELKTELAAWEWSRNKERTSISWLFNVESARENLRGLVPSTSQNLCDEVLVNDVTNATLTLSSAAEQMNSISDQVASTATEQEHQSAMIATAITQMSSAIEQVAANALSTSEKATHTDKTAKLGQQSVQENIDAINRLSQIVNANTPVNELNTQTTDINQVVMMIKESQNKLIY